MEYYTSVLPNGIRLIHKPANSDIAHFGLLINTGSRDEEANEHGMAHFIEHAIFKGTQKRKSYHIISRLEDVGGELNAYTTKEETCIHASFLREDYERTIELISDIVFHSIFPEKELEKEKEVIADEINSYKDNPSELIFDDYEEIMFPNNALGRNILGTPKSLKRIKRKDLMSFISNNYHTDQMVVSSIGNLPINKVLHFFKKYFTHVPTNLRNKERKTVNEYHPTKKILNHNTNQVHCVIGNIAYDIKNEKRLPLYLLTNILGGPGMNSRLNLLLREKYGYTYNVEASYQPYCNTGVFSVYFGSDKENLDKSINLTFREFNKFRTQKLGEIQLSKAKKQLIGQLAIASENNESQMLNIGKSLLVFDKVDAIEEINRKIHSITSSQLLEIANEILHPEMLSSIIYK